MQNSKLSDVKGKELIAIGHELAKTLSHDTPLTELAKLLSEMATRLDCAIVRGDAHMQAEMVWEKSMMEAIGEDGVGCVVKAINALKAERDALAAENVALKATVDAVIGVADNSDGIAGWHKNGELASWYELLPELDAEFRETDAFPNSVRADAIPENLKLIGELIRTQDNRITDQPMFVVFEKREIIGSDEHSPSRIVWVWEGEEVDELRGKRLELLYQDGRDTRDYDRYAMQEIDVFVTACFTEQGCKDYLHQNGHNLRQPYIYAAGSYRNDEYQTLRNWLLSLPLRAGKDGE